ncbi:hypothetical protein BKA62DRAFT_613781 [Auriculariales sp. MPI-PUGE-AT-0066]|nr:hypothetical protein BKA62DRAFT_613781 [Auriculariales sp. MPI-PUGE-AT-0066]
MTPFNLPNFPNAFIVCFIDAEAKAKHVAQLADFRAAEYVNRLACKDSSRPTVKGQMMVATCDLREGETVVREWPLLLWPQRFFVGSVEQAEHFLSLAVNNLNPVRGAEYRSLKNAWKDYTGSDFRGAGELSGILNTNMVRISGSPATDDCPYGGIFPSLSRMNHSCQPNSSYNYDSHTMTIELRASRSIRKGEEVTISYNCELMQPTVARRGRLFDTYRFTCECGACTAASSDARRAQILATPHTTRREFFTWLASRHLAVQQPQFADDYLIDRAKVGYALYAREKLVEPVLVESLTHAETIMGCYLARGMGREAKFWAGKVRGHMLSHFLPESRDAKVGPTSPEKSELWNGREKFEGREQP